MHKLALLFTTALSGLLLAGNAAALSLTPNPLLMDTPDFTGELELLEVVTGLPTGAVGVEGTVEADDVTLVFEARTGAGPNPWDLMVVGIFGMTSNGAGVIDGPGDPLSVLDLSGGGARFFSNIALGGTSQRFFISYDAVADDGSQTLGWLVASGATPGTGQSGTLVPEPGVGLLFGAGLALLAGRSRRRAR
ncbi:MAG: PEP-CTERM sorting domain-containing protein [Proteobacteria bacterium]|nr:PEP-CTERM sorting domain-containing protein [Pseudomonadota bacterium]